MTNSDYKIEWEHNNKLHRVTLDLADIATIVSDEIRENSNRAQGKILPAPRTKKVEREYKKKEKKECQTCGSKGIKRLLMGSAKLLKAELGIDACDEKTITDRRNLCESCEHYDFGVCDQCGCFCAAKVKLKSEECPKGLW